ncbi:MAG: CinA family protein [Candidatus Omnitrophota bacterium]|nr:CinA family protein [Candidatus Omnitrophota bacterium]MDZ4242936.1 CinA family protein [Candidatus Omnitrophota bacterium]
MTLEQKVANRMEQHGKSLAVAESCSGGLLSHRLTNIPGSSQFLKFSLVAYAYEAKTRLLHVPPALLKRYGAVSEPVVRAMADNARKLLGTDFSIGITGIAGPGGATATKPVGLVYIAVSSRSRTVCRRCLFRGSRLQIKKQSTDQALRMLLQFLA